MTNQPLPPTTTLEENKKTQGQRLINVFWEATQSIIALAITLANIIAEIKGIHTQMLNSAFFLIVGFYFSRTNHTKVGGIGSVSGDTR